MMDNEKRKNIYIMILSALVVVASIVAVLFFVESRSVKETLVAKEQEYKSSLDSVNDESATKVENTVVEKEVEKKVEVEVGKFVPFDSNKILNAQESMIYKEESIKYCGMSLYINDKGIPIINFGYDLKNYFSDVGYKINLESIEYDKDVLIDGFSKKVVNCYFGLTGQSVFGSIMLFLMEDGTVEYIPVIEALQKNTFKSYGKIPNVENVIRFVNGGFGYKNGGGALTVFAINKKGEAYDLTEQLRKNNLYGFVE